MTQHFQDILDVFDSYNLISYYCEYNYKEQLSSILTQILDFEDADEYIEDFLQTIDYIFPERNNTSEDYDIVEQSQIDYLKNCYQPEQKTEEWYKFRNNLITASSAWKIIHTQSTLNDFIFNKCKPFEISKYYAVNINSPFHWGNKYEDVSVSLYKHLNNVEVTDFGCIAHKTHAFLGASPDGIVTSKHKLGRMLEIKNIVNREITGIPKKEYWIQMQLQMEVCDLNDCDFLECRFKEYKDEDDFNNDGTFTKTKDGKYKGIMVQFYDGNKPIYKYSPFLCSEDEFNIWNEKIMNENESWIKTIYWYLDEYSCIHIKRNKLWFESIVPILSSTWQTIKKEKTQGYHHRKPKSSKKKIKKEEQVTLFSLDTIKNIL